MKVSLRVTCLAIVIGAAGCGGKGPYATSGVVFFKDTDQPAKELAGYLIMFQSLEHKTSANGVIQPDGSFQMGTLTNEDGAMSGKHRVALTPPMPQFDKPSPPSRIAARYAGFDTSQLEVEIKPQRNQLTIKVEQVKR